jgi:hypothetical protein
MLYTQIDPATKRAQFRERLASGELLRVPGAFNPLSARLIQDKGFDGVYISGAVISADLGLPDIGLTTLTEVAGRSQQISRMTDLLSKMRVSLASTLRTRSTRSAADTSMVKRSLTLKPRSSASGPRPTRGATPTC